MNATSTNPATLFAFQNERVRVMTDATGEPWFVVADVCRALKHSNPTMAIEGMDADDLSTAEAIDSMGRTQVVNILSEPGLYQLVLTSRAEKAHEFKRWVTKEVIPQIRKTGSYSVAPVLPSITFPEALRLLADAEEAKLALTDKVAELKPKAEFFDAVTASEDTLGMNEAAKLLGIGRNRLMANLRSAGVFRANNTPYQRYIDDGHFKVVESKWTDSRGDAHVTLSTRVFQRGVEFIRRKFSVQ